MAGTGDRGEVAEVGEVADAPGALRADRVELGLQAEGALGDELLVGGQARRGDHEIRLDRPLLRVRHEPVPAQRQMRGEMEAGPAAQGAVEVERRGVVLGLLEVAPPAVLQPQVRAHRGAVVDVDGHRRGGVLAQHRHRRQGAGPGGACALAPHGCDVLRGVHRCAERREDGMEGVVGDILEDAVPAPVPGADTEVAGEISQR